MKQQLHFWRFLATSLFLAFSIFSWAYDFVSGGIYYNINSDKISVTVTYESKSYKSYSGSITIPSEVTYNNKIYSVTSIGDNAFWGSKSLTSVIIPNSITSIGEFAFAGGTGLTSVDIPNSVTSIGEYAFDDCTGLTSVAIPNSVTSIGQYAFSNCTGLSSVDIPESLKNIEEGVFNECSGLETITIPNSVTSIGRSAFYGTGLIQVTIPESVTSISRYAFSECKNLKTVTILSNIIVSTSRSASGCLKDVFGTHVYEYIFSNTLKKIGDYAFYQCSGIQSVTIPNSVTTICDKAFWQCRYMESLSIGKNVTSIGKYAFSSCSNLKDVYCYAEQVPTTNDSFTESGPNNSLSNAKLHVPASSINTYKTQYPWSLFGNIVPLPYIIGDANGNGEVEIGDVTSVLTLMATPEVKGYNNKAADANGNGVIEIGDVTTILTIMAGN